MLLKGRKALEAESAGSFFIKLILGESMGDLYRQYQAIITGGVAKMKSGAPTLIIGGQARLPKELSTGEVFQIIAEVDPERSEVLDVSFSPCLPVLDKMLREIVVGANLEMESSRLMEIIEERLHHRSKKAVITAIKDLAREYKEFRYRTPKESGEQE